MDLTKKREELRADYEESLKILNTIEEHGLQEWITHVNGKNIFTRNFGSVKSGLEIFSVLGKYKLSTYYVSANPNDLSVVYEFDMGVEVVFFVPLSEIEVVSQGKCEIVEKTRTEKTVVCNLGD